ncbi:MAG: hypothetical protein PHN49_04425 [Candidatus Omnitrophica bacterium]|nr:hypothetical protein [Candidatus Omnitrophota bacterium]MDD5670868.1 hypothetical protein [Candidatus Omnitrophota bacterium]
MMNYPELLQAIKKIRCEEVRVDSDEFYEMVIRKDSLKELSDVLGQYFGPPLKTAEAQPSREASKAAEPYGGIWKGQTLYYLEHDRQAHVAMLWPWSDGVTITLKMIQGRKAK